MAGRVYTTAIEIGAQISKAFRGDALNAAKALEKLSAETKKLKEAEKVAGSYKRLDDAVRASKTRLDQASDSLRRLEQAEKASGEATQESTKWRRAGERAVAKAAKEFDRATKAAEKNGEALRKMGVDTANLAKEQERLARTLSATERQEKALSQFEAKRTRLFGERKGPEPLVGKAREQIGGIARDVALLGTAAIAAGTAVGGLALKTLNAGDEIGDTADKLGIEAKALQELRYGAKQSGAEVESLDKALAKMAVSIGKSKAAKGKGGTLMLDGVQMADLKSASDAAAKLDPFKQLGLNAKKLSALKPDEQLKQIADGMRKLKTHSDKAAVAQAIFGKGGTDLLPFLEAGSAGIEKLSKAAHKYGGVLSKETLDAADAADKAMKDAELAFSGLTATIGGSLLPVVTDVFKKFSTWVVENRGQIKQWAEQGSRWIVDTALPALVKIGQTVYSVGTRVASLVDGAAKLAGGFGNLGIIVAGLRLAPLAITLSKIGISGIQAGAALVRFMAAGGSLTATFAPALPALAAFAAVALSVALAIRQITSAVEALGGAGAVWNDLKDFVGRGGMDHMTRTGAGNRDLFEAQQAENERNLAKARALRPAGSLPAAPTGGVNLGGVNVTVGGTPSDQKIHGAFAEAADHTIRKLRAESARRRRVAFAEDTP